MAMDKYTKINYLIRTGFRTFYQAKLSTSRQKAYALPGFEIPRSGSVELFLAPRAGTTLCFIHRSDYVAAYKHTVGQLIGALAHFHLMEEREIREAIRASKTHPDMPEIKQNKIDALKISKRILADRTAGKIILALATDIPEVPQQAKELSANFMPIAKMLQAHLTTTIKKKKLCQALEFYSVSSLTDPPTVQPLVDAMKPMLKLA